jgi:hypothetical protein
MAERLPSERQGPLAISVCADRIKKAKKIQGEKLDSTMDCRYIGDAQGRVATTVTIT